MTPSLAISRFDMARTTVEWRRALGAVAIAACVLSACNGDERPASTAIGTTTPTTIVFAPVATRAPLLGLAPETSAAGSEAAGSDSTVPGSEPATTPPTVPPTTAAPTTSTTEPIAVQGLELNERGIGSAMFGASPDGVIDYVRAFLGSDTADTGWVAPDTFGVCEGTSVRKVDWGALSLLFSDLSPFANGRPHFMGWEYGKDGGIGEEPVGLRTPGGITLGSRVVDVLAEFPDAQVNAGDAELGVPDHFYVSNVFYGLLTGTTQDDYVLVMFGGYGCGE